MPDVNIDIEPATTDLLTRTAENRNTSVDRLVREMLVLYTSIELQQATADLQRVLRGERSSEATDTPEGNPACPYCRCSAIVRVADSFEEYGVYCCSNICCPLGTFVKRGGSLRDEEIRMVVEVVDDSYR